MVFWRGNILGQPARKDFTGFGQDLTHQTSLVWILDQDNNLIDKQIAAWGEGAAVFNLDTAPAWHMRELHGPKPNLFGRVWRFKGIWLGWHIRNLDIPGGVGRKVKSLALFC